MRRRSWRSGLGPGCRTKYLDRLGLRHTAGCARPAWPPERKWSRQRGCGDGDGSQGENYSRDPGLASAEGDADGDFAAAQIREMGERAVQADDRESHSSEGQSVEQKGDEAPKSPRLSDARVHVTYVIKRYTGIEFGDGSAYRSGRIGARRPSRESSWSSASCVAGCKSLGRANAQSSEGIEEYSRQIDQVVARFGQELELNEYISSCGSKRPA
jgi:hypothetical protein